MRDFINIVESMAKPQLTENINPPRLLTMVHGTDIYNAERIMHEGFVVKPEWKSYGEDEDPLLESLDGAYFAENLAISIKYAERSAQEGDGTLAIIEGEINLNNAVPDEDVITNAIHRASRARDADSFAKILHSELDPQHKKEPNMKLLVAFKKAYDQAQSYEDAHIQKYRTVLDKLCRAYAHTILEPAVHLYGRTVRLPDGLPPENITSITTFVLAEGYKVKHVEAMKGEPIELSRLQAAVDDLVNQGIFG